MLDQTLLDARSTEGLESRTGIQEAGSSRSRNLIPSPQYDHDLLTIQIKNRLSTLQNYVFFLLSISFSLSTTKI